VSSSHHHQHRRRRRPRSRVYQRQASAPISTFASTSYRSDPPSDDEDISTVINEEISTGHLPQPDIVQSTMNEDYCHHLQQMAELSNQQRFNEQSIPFFGKDDHLKTKEPSQMPTTSLEKSLLINGK
jgi:hypothetical protein